MSPIFHGPVLSKTGPCLELLGTIAVPVVSKEFVPCEHFIQGRYDDVIIGEIGKSFSKWFLDSKNVEERKGETLLHYSRNCRPVTDYSIIEDLQKKGKVEISLAEIFVLMMIQCKGCPGVLNNNGSHNIFYSKDVRGILRIVFVFWMDSSWFVYSRPLWLFFHQPSDSRIFTRCTLSI